MTKIIAILLALGQFEVAVETSKGCFVAMYPDTDIGVTQFLRAIRPAETLRTGLRDPGTGHSPSLVGSERIKKYVAGNPTDKLDAKLAEKMCLSAFPPNYMQLCPATEEATAFHRGAFAR